MRTLHFISGLPRSGSTLLSALLRQNPRFHAEMSSPVCGLYLALQNSMSGKQEFHSFFDEAKRVSILKGIFHSYHASVPDSDVVFDTNRMWSSKIAGLVQLFPNAKFICCVRSPAWILDSIERLVRKNAYEPSRMFNYQAGNNLYGRVSMLMKPGGLVRSPYESLREAFFGDYTDRLLLITYERLASQPVEVLKTLYDFIGEPYFEHDTANVEYTADEFDHRLGTPGLHRVSGKVELVNRTTILPPDIFDRYKNTTFWADPNQNKRGVAVV
ncbi:MAG TPA: sulfotransferase [Vicinamibacterales bacterium]|nr:sulfotransferase [Vicinamibacterales bacterium]